MTNFTHRLCFISLTRIPFSTRRVPRKTPVKPSAVFDRRLVLSSRLLWHKARQTLCKSRHRLAKVAEAYGRTAYGWRLQWTWARALEGSDLSRAQHRWSNRMGKQEARPTECLCWRCLRSAQGTRAHTSNGLFRSGMHCEVKAKCQKSTLPDGMCEVAPCRPTSAVAVVRIQSKLRFPAGSRRVDERMSSSSSSVRQRMVQSPSRTSSFM